jgi:integrase
MGRKSATGGVAAVGEHRIQFTFKFEGVRYRPTLLITPTEARLRRAREQLASIKARIAAGIFSFAEEFPDYVHLKKVPRAGSPRTCGQVFDDFLAHCAARRAKTDCARRGPLRCVLRRAFKFGYRDHPELHDPARQLKGARIQRKDRPVIDPFTIHEAETLIAALHRDWGEAQGNYDEFRFFTGLRPSEQIALVVADFDAARGTLSITKARVNGHDKDATKTGEDRRVELCPRALAILKRQLTLRAELERTGQIDHDHLFFQANGTPIRNLQYPYTRWRRTFARMRRVRYRKPYCARHSSVSWDLMIGRSALWVARQHGHSIATMLRFYAAWAEGALEADVAAIRAAMENPRRQQRTSSFGEGRSRTTCSVVRPFEIESAPIVSPTSSRDSFANGFASGRHRPSAKCVNRFGLIWRRERDSNGRGHLRISKLLEDFAFPSPAVPSHPRICHQGLSAPRRCCPVN